jgi:hypothetical protein
MSVKANLKAAMLRLFNLDLAAVGAIKMSYIWIDAICIDQHNVAERNEQVEFMSSIYKAAQNVIIWLGPEDQFTTDSIAAVRRLASIHPSRYNSVSHADFYQNQASCRKLGIPEMSHFLWLSLTAFFQRSWFKRAWIVQELIFARNAVVVCGDYVLPWATIGNTVTFLATSGWHDLLHTATLRQVSVVRKDPGKYREMLRTDTDVGMTSVYLESKRAGIEARSNLLPLHYLLQVFRYTSAGDPRDHIYAFLNLARKDRHPFKDDADAIQVDYNMPVNLLYTNTMKLMLRAYGDLRFLPQVQDVSDARMTDLPSWVIDYSATPRNFPLSMAGTCNWNASPSTRPWEIDCRPTKSPLLDVQGFLIDVVEHSAVRPVESKYRDAYWVSVFKVALSGDGWYARETSDGSAL